GDRVDVTVATAGPADSLAGGTLFMVPMTGPLPGAPVMAYAEGLVSIPDADTPTVGVIKNGAQMTRDVLSVPMDEYFRLRLVIDESHAGWPTATAVAAQLNGSIAPDGPRLAEAVDGKNVLVTVPLVQRDRPGPFINDVLTTFIDMSFIEGGARVVVNRRTGAVVISGEVRVSPMLIRHDGLTITTLDPQPIGTPLEPVTTELPFAALDPDDRGGARLADLLAAFNQLKVPSADLIEILETMHDSGKLHAELIIK
ncbi:MAG: flagellar basal body P-ring protein FlgI, partial [Planctomycetota bacterium]